MGLETYAVRLGTGEIPYTVRRSSRRKSIAISIHPDHGVRVTAPYRFRPREIREAVQGKAGWISKNLSRVLVVWKT